MGVNKYPPVICVSGKIASGKTYYSKFLAGQHDWIRCSISDYLRYLLKTKGHYNPSRAMLQEQGEKEINKGWNHFAKSFMEFAIANISPPILIIDGVRHVEFFEQIRYLVNPEKCLLIYIDAPDMIIQQRLIERGEMVVDYNCLAEGNQLDLMGLADYVSKGNVENIEQFIKKQIL